MLKYKNPIIIYNPTAGGGSAQKKFKKYYDKLVENNLFQKIDIITTRTKEEALDKIEGVCRSKKNDLIITIGGDGTISTAVNGIMRLPKEDRVPLFPLPSGTGDSLLRDFDVTNIDRAIENYKRLESTKLYDLFYVEETEGDFKWYCINILGMGFISDIADYAVKNGKKLGALTYVVSLFAVLGRFRPYKISIKYGDDKTELKNDKTYFLTISNTKYTGGAIKVAPDAKFDDGLMDVVYLHDLNRLQFLNGFMKTFKGTHVKQKKLCGTLKTNYLEIEADPQFLVLPDGDLIGKTPLRITVKHKEVEIVV